MTQPPEGGAATNDAGHSTGDGDGFSAPTSHYSVGYAQPSDEAERDSAVDTTERRVVSIDEADDDFGPATISGRGYESSDSSTESDAGATSSYSSWGRPESAAAGAAATDAAESTSSHSSSSHSSSSHSSSSHSSDPADSATTAYDHPGQYGLSGSAVTSSYGSYAGAPVTAPPTPSATATTERSSSTTTSSRAARARGPRRASLQLRHINPWTVLKFSCVLAIALFFVWLIIVGVLFGILDAAGVVGKINETAITINGPGSKAPITVGVVFGGAALVGVINVILFIALSTVGSIIYNLCADLVGGVEVTLSET